ncbi:MAG: RNA polymerase sigma factor [Deltaproteobacteria bacterium]|nr:RNA polymerase sigma factor [Deltaproteobacteria bacterium]
MNELPDERLIEAALGGDDEAFIQLVGKHKRRVMGLAARFTQIRDELDDICQEVFIKIYNKLRTYKNDAPFEHWLSRITVNACYDALRKKKLTMVNTSVMYNLTFDIADSSSEDRQTAEEAYYILSRGLAKLKAPERLVITLLELEEKSIREVAELTGWSETNVKVRAFRARKALRKILEDNYHE